MQPKKIIIKTLSSNLNNEFCNTLLNYPKINFFNKKINGEYVTIVKCYNYYDSISIFNSYTCNPNIKSIYANYIYLYTNISLILSELIINFFEKSIVNGAKSHYNIG